MPIATRLTNTGTLLVNGSFDEQTDNLVYNSNLTLYLNASKTSSYPGTGATWSDLSGNGNNATLIGSPTYTTTQVGAIRFNASGTGQYANVPVAAIPSGGSQVSVCCWINLGNPATPPAASVFSCFDSVGNRIVNIHLPWSDSIVYWDAGNSGGSFNRINTSTLTTAQKTGWHHWAFTLNATAGTMAIYLDGVSIATGTGKTRTLGTVSTATYRCAIANFAGSANWNGSVSSFQIYNVALTDAQVAQNYSATSGPFTKFKITSTTVYATELDEVTINGGSVAKREINTGVLQVKNIFDEFTGAPVVDTSLQLWLDAGQSTSYPGTGNTWTNLANASANTTLINTPTFDTQGWLAFNGTDESANTGLPGATTFTTDSDFTISCWARFSAYKAAATSIGTLVGAFNYQGYGLYWNGTPSSYTFGSYMRYASVVSSRVSSAVSLNTWYMVTQVYSRSGNFHQLYLNNTLSGNTTSISGTFNSNLNTVFLGIGYGVGSDGTPGGGTPGTRFLGDISQAMIYNRALSADEITTNFNALRGRYGV